MLKLAWLATPTGLLALQGAVFVALLVPGVWMLWRSRKEEAPGATKEVPVTDQLNRLEASLQSLDKREAERWKKVQERLEAPVDQGAIEEMARRVGALEMTVNELLTALEAATRQTPGGTFVAGFQPPTATVSPAKPVEATAAEAQGADLDRLLKDLGTLKF